MSATTSIEWTERTWNPVRGCSVISPGCVNCYAMKTAHRFSGVGGPYEGLTKQTSAGPQWAGIVRPVESVLLEPLSWRKPSKVFVNSMSDLFHEGVPDAFIDRVFAVMALAPLHTFQILTKRPERMRAYFAESSDPDERAMLPPRISQQATSTLITKGDIRQLSWNEPPWPLPNVWLGVSVENQHFADERIPLLLQTPAAVRFISAEPLLGPVSLRLSDAERIARFKETTGALSGGARHPDRCVCQDGPDAYPGTPHTHYAEPPHSCARCGSGNCSAYRPAVQGLDWVIVGGESGPGARPFDLAWARSIVQQCQAAGVPVFVKQIGSHPTLKDAASSTDGLLYARFKDRKGGDPAEWPEDLRVREFPTVQGGGR